MKKGLSPLPHTRWMIGFLCLGLFPGCGLQMPDLSSGTSAQAAPVVSTVPRAADALAIFAATATPGNVQMVNGERARLVRSYNAASGRECREILLGAGNSERTAVACRDASGNFVSSQPLLRGSSR